MNEVPLGDMISLFNKAYPILPDTPGGDTKRAIEQFYSSNIGSVQVISDPLPEWSQGDIVEPLIFIDWNEDGEPLHFESPGMIITSTCDLDRKDNVVFCPCYLLSSLGDKNLISDASKNIVFEFFYVDKILDGNQWVVDLSRPMTLPRERVFKKLESGDISRRHSLTSRGWYLFITKFSMKYFRPDDPDNFDLRS